MGVDLNGRQAQNWGPFQSPRTEKAISSGHQAVDSKQKVLFDAISQVVLAAATDQHGQVEDKKYRYVVDLILDRVRDALAKQTIALDKDTLASIKENNKLLVQTTADVFSGLLETAFKNLQVTVSEDQQDDFLDEIDEKLSNAVDDIVERISEKSSSGDIAKSDSSKELFVAGIKSYFDKKFGNDSSKTSKSSLGSGDKTSKLKSSFKASSFILMQKSLAALSKNQSLINTKLTQKFESTSQKISGNVETLEQNTQGSLDEINDKISSPMKSVKGLFKKLATSLTSIVSGGIKIAFRGISKVLGGIVSGLKWTTKKRESFLKAPLKIVGEFLKKVLLSPFGLYAIGYLAGWMYKKFIKPLWDWAKPIREAISKWFGGEISFKEMAGQIWTHLKTAWDETIKPWMTNEVWKPIKAAIVDFWETGTIGGFSVKKIITGVGLVVGAYAVYKIFKIIRGIWRFAKATYKAFKLVANFIKMIGAKLGIKLPQKPIKPTKPIKPRKPTKPTKPTKPIKPRKPPKLLKKPGVIKKSIGALKNSTIVSKVKGAGSAIAASKVGQAVGAAAKVGAKVLNPLKPALKVGGKALNVLGDVALGYDIASSGYGAYKDFKKGDAMSIVDGLMKANRAASMTAIYAGVSRYAGHRVGSTVANLYGLGLDGAEWLGDKAGGMIGDAVFAGQNEHLAKQLYKNGKAIAGPQKAIEDAVSKVKGKSAFEKLLDKHKNFDTAKIEYDKFNAKIEQLQKELKWSILPRTKAKLTADIEKLQADRQVMLINAGLSGTEIERGKLQLETSREVKHLMTQLTDEQKARYAQLQEQTLDGPDGLKLHMSQESILEAMQKEFESRNDEASKKMDDVKDGIDDVKQVLTEEIQKVGLKFEKISNGDGTISLNIIQPQVQVPQTGIGLDLQ